MFGTNAILFGHIFGTSAIQFVHVFDTSDIPFGQVLGISRILFGHVFITCNIQPTIVPSTSKTNNWEEYNDAGQVRAPLTCWQRRDNETQNNDNEIEIVVTCR